MNRFKLSNALNTMRRKGLRCRTPRLCYLWHSFDKASGELKSEALDAFRVWAKYYNYTWKHKHRPKLVVLYNSLIVDLLNRTDSHGISSDTSDTKGESLLFSNTLSTTHLGARGGTYSNG